MTIHDLETALEQLSHEEKVRMLQHLARTLIHAWPGVEKTPGVHGGDACIVRTRIPIWTLEAYRQRGWNDAAILANFPTLRTADLVSAWLYVDAHRAEIAQALRQPEED
jgi:uncharacterized protein (DUF433 family)